MAKCRVKTQARNLPAASSSSFVVIRISPSLLSRFAKSTVQVKEERHAQTRKAYSTAVDMKTRNAWSRNLANSNRACDSPGTGSSPTTPTRKATKWDSSSARKNAIHPARPILKPSGARRQTAPNGGTEPNQKRVSLDSRLNIQHFDRNSGQFFSPNGDVDDTVGKDIMTDTNPSGRPALKLRLSTSGGPLNGIIQTTLPQSATRTPSLKLSFSRASIGVDSVKPKVEDINGDTPKSSAKKRKRQSIADVGQDDQVGDGRPAPPARRLTFKMSKSTGPPSAPPTAPILKLKSRGKIPKRPLGVGYDSELEDREVDPVVLEGFVLRMEPGPDCEYVKNAITEGTVGVSRAQGGADIRMRMLDTQGRRGILVVRGNQYATSLVDLPCIIEGMKSWDKRGFIKSIDISQMMLVLGSCKNDEEARNFPLPSDINPKNYQYAHGLTAPMKWVRKRRFNRTKRARVDDIEAVERRVNALLEADRLSVRTRHTLLDHDPRLDERQFSSADEEDEDAEGEDQDDDYFGLARTGMGAYGTNQAEDVGQEEVDEFARMFDDDEDDEPPPTTVNGHQPGRLQAPDGDISSFAVTSTSASPSATNAHTPATAAQSSDEDDDDEDRGEDDDEDRDDSEKEGDENLQQQQDRIEDMEKKIKEQTEILKKTTNAIVRKKLARKIQELQDDVAMMKKSAGIGGDDDDYGGS